MSKCTWFSRDYLVSSILTLISCGTLFLTCTSTKAATTVVAAGGDLQAAINTAACGDVVVLQAGATWDGTFLYSHNCPDRNRITIRSSGYASLPATGHVGSNTISDTISDSSNMARLRTLGGGSYGAAIETGTNAGGLTIDGIELTDNAATTVDVTMLLDFGLGHTGAHDVTVTRCWLHQKETGTSYNRTVQRGVWAEGTNISLTSSYVYLIGYYYSAVTGVSNYQMDTTSFISVGGPGPFSVSNNFISVWWNGMFLGGGDTAAQNVANVTSGTTTSGVFSNVTGISPGLVLRMEMHGTGTLDGSDFVCSSPNPNGYHCTHYTETSGFTITSADNSASLTNGHAIILTSGGTTYTSNVWKSSGGGVSEIMQNVVFTAGSYSAILYETSQVSSVSGSTVNYSPYGTDAITTSKVPTTASWNYGDQGLIHDITVQRNVFDISATFAQDVYNQKGYVPKGWIEIKNCKRFLLDGNLWIGYPSDIAFTATNQKGTAPWIADDLITITNNKFVPETGHTESCRWAVMISPNAYINTVTPMTSAEISNNLITNLRSLADFARTFNVLVKHNTVINDQLTSSGYNDLIAGTDVATSLTFKDNIANYASYGIQWFAPYNFSTNYPSGVFLNNVVVDLNSAGFSTSQWGTGSILSPIPVSYSGTFVNAAGGDYTLAVGSPYHNAASDGTDPGVNVLVLQAAIAGTSPIPTPTPTPTPTATPTATPTPTVTPTPNL